MAAVISLVVLFSWGAALGQWGGHMSRKLQPATRGVPVNLPEVEAAIVNLTNDIRRRQGLTMLLEEGICRDAARGHSADMLNRNYFSHFDPQGLTVRERLPADLAARKWGENIWTGRGNDPRQVRKLAEKIMDGWLKSAGHRENILNPGYTHLGVGVMAKNQEINATQVFIGMGGAGSPGSSLQRK